MENFIFWDFKDFFTVMFECPDMIKAPGRSLYESPDKFDLAEQKKKSPVFAKTHLPKP